MDRREFVRAAGGAAAAALLARTRELGAAPPGPFSGWAWVHGDAAGTAGEWRDRFARLRAAGVTGALVSGGPTTLLAEAARATGVAFHRWLWILNRPGDEWVKTNHPEWYSVSRAGDSSLEKPPYVDYYQWVCPTRAPVREYLRGVVAEVARETSQTVAAKRSSDQTERRADSGRAVHRCARLRLRATPRQDRRARSGRCP